MHNIVKLQQTTLQTRLPEHEKAARKHRAAVVGLPLPAQPKPPTPHVGRKTWHVAWPDPGSKNPQPRFETHPAS